MACSVINLNICTNIQIETLKMAGVMAKVNFPQDLWQWPIRPITVESQSRTKAEDAQRGLSPFDAMKKYSKKDDSCHTVTRLAVERYTRTNNFQQFSLFNFSGTDTHCQSTVVEENGIGQVENAGGKSVCPKPCHDSSSLTVSCTSDTLN